MGRRRMDYCGQAAGLDTLPCENHGHSLLSKGENARVAATDWSWRLSVTRENGVVISTYRICLSMRPENVR